MEISENFLIGLQQIKILYDKWRGHSAVGGLDGYRNFTKYLLHYVGISKLEDSLTRLVVRPHDKRIRILSNEHPHTEDSRVTDEIMLLFFTVSPLRLTTFIRESDIKEDSFSTEINITPIICDAEKAFTKIMDTKYNKVKYKNYPKGIDGLYDAGFDRYLYALADDIELHTETENIRGGYISEYHLSNQQDVILIEGEKVTLMKYDSG